ncbi:MAG: 3'-5' exonuclease [Clostridiales bacterium]|nr:3'-5' exonuclease [Clostridiales bacterium]
MNELIISAHQTPGHVTFDNYKEVRSKLISYIRPFDGIEYTLDDLDTAVKNRDELKEFHDAVTGKKKELKEAYSAPFVVVDGMLDELLAIIDEPYKKAKNFVLDAEKELKKQRILDYAKSRAASLGDVGEKIVASPSFFSKKWLNQSFSDKKCRDAVDEIIARAADDLLSISAAGGENVAAMTAHYVETLSMDSVKSFLSSLKVPTDDPIETVSENNVLGYKILKITATEDQMASILDRLELMNVDVEELEDGMPKPMTQLTAPDFDSFVSFDIETTGSFGAGDAEGEARITEIGAVRVVDGRIVDKFDMLADPGRKILPYIERLTHITNAMVAGKPPVDDVIRAFREFVGDSILVGHNIKNSDLHYIKKAAERAGVSFSGAFLDTYILAKSLKEKTNWEKLKLEYLSEYYGLTHTDAHRAWSDAEVTAQLYFELKKIL